MQPPELKKPIAFGRTAEIYPWQDGKILKLYYDWCPRNWVEYEARLAQAVVEGGIPSPKAGEIIEIHNRRGLVYERVEGASMLVEMNSHPWRILYYSRLLAELQVRIHQLRIPSLPAYREELKSAILKTTYLDEPLRKKALLSLESLPEGEVVCHGDFHPGNVLMTAKGPVVIDWMTATRGDPWADVARTSLLITIGPRGARQMVSAGLLLGLKLAHWIYLNRYRALSPDPEGLFERWLPVMAAARLNEDIPPEREALLQIVRKAFDSVI
jgi:uncharacterized protein (TIGR02172 family)